MIEAKREPVEDPDRNIDPYSPVVIDQAAEYAMKLGAQYFATYNGKRLVLFNTFERGVPLLERKTRAYEVSDISQFGSEILREVAAIDADIATWDPHVEAFVKRLKTFHDVINEQFSEALAEMLGEQDEFQSRYERWVNQQGWEERYEEDPKEIHERYTSQAAYLLMNKLVFYKLRGCHRTLITP